LRGAGFGVVEMDWDAATAALQSGEASLVVADGEAISALTQGRKAPATELPREVARSLSHDLRTPLSAMAGWLHLMESGKLDEAGLKRAIGKLRGNIDDQVQTIERYLGATQEGQR
jgi:signal transduction histidine kinase